jgi:hypothetical protein
MMRASSPGFPSFVRVKSRGLPPKGRRAHIRTPHGASSVQEGGSYVGDFYGKNADGKSYMRQ